MIVQERRRRIIEIVKEQGSISTKKLSNILEVSEMTIRRDLNYLDRQLVLTKTFGGAVDRSSSHIVTNFSLRLNQYKERKKMIALKAKDFIQEGDSIFIDHSTTCLELSKLLGKFSHIMVITHSLPIIVELSRKTIEVICIGGMLKQPNDCFVGPLAEEIISRIHVDKAFVGTQGVSIEKGLTDTDMFEVSIKKKIIESSDNVILLADHTKFDRIGIYQTVPIENINTIITDNNVNCSLLEPYQKSGIEIIIAQN